MKTDFLYEKGDFFTKKKKKLQPNTPNIIWPRVILNGIYQLAMLFLPLSLYIFLLHVLFMRTTAK